jgi:hypothetical protein
MARTGSHVGLSSEDGCKLVFAHDRERVRVYVIIFIAAGFDIFCCCLFDLSALPTRSWHLIPS